ncbi:MAG: hypothetical protein EOP42_03040 [Sphingobacteriaceae bacterium]|nr:MAG: hypothetical protein EOP42_03040 [Sphingobacteriaceae bacterium]
MDEKTEPNAATQLALQYKPEQVKILLIGEAPGRADKNFYLGNNNLYRTVIVAFKQLYGEFSSRDEFLAFFKSAGCFLDHIGLEHTERHDLEKRKANRQNGIISLSEKLKIYQPETVIILMKALEKQVQQAIDLSAITSIKHQTTVSYPAGSDTNRLACIRGLVAILQVSVPDF